MTHQTSSWLDLRNTKIFFYPIIKPTSSCTIWLLWTCPTVHFAVVQSRFSCKTIRGAITGVSTRKPMAVTASSRRHFRYTWLTNLSHSNSVTYKHIAYLYCITDLVSVLVLIATLATMHNVSDTIMMNISMKYCSNAYPVQRFQQI